MPKVSVIIATHNYAVFIGDALRSVEAQTLGDWECIVVDDASTDGTAEVVGSFMTRDARFRYERLDQNSGVSVARNTGFQKALGEYVQLLDADDVIAPQKLERQVAFLERTPSCSVVYSDHIRFTGTSDLSRSGELNANDKLHGGSGEMIDRLIRGNMLRLNAVLFRRSILKDVVGFRPAFRHVEDWDFWIRIALAGHRFHFLDDPASLAGVRMEHQSLSRDLPAMRKFHLPVRQYMFTQGVLTFKQRFALLLRYCDFLLEMVILKREPVLFQPEGRAWFVPLVVCCSLLLLPIWLMARPFIRPLW